MGDESWLQEQLLDLRSRDLERRLFTYPEAGGKFRLHGRTYLNFSSNDYLGLSRHPHVVDGAMEALRTWGGGATSSRLVTGTLPLHEALEQRLARHKGYAGALVFGSGFLTNVGVIPALAGRKDVVLADKLVHASIVDAVVLSRASFVRFRHNDVDHLERLLASRNPGERKLVITESVFSMDGDVAPLRDLAGVAEKYGAMMMVDEAHAAGVFGPGGAGLVRAWQLEPYVNICMGTLSKALGSYGGFVACSEAMRAHLINHARSFIYSTAMPPPVAGAALGALDVLERQPNMGERLLGRAHRFRIRLADSGLDTGASTSQIIPIMVGESAKALALSRRLRDGGLIAVAIRPPTVPRGAARIRLSVTLDHQEEDLQQAARALIEAARAEGVL